MQAAIDAMGQATSPVPSSTERCSAPAGLLHREATSSSSGSHVRSLLNSTLTLVTGRMVTNPRVNKARRWAPECRRRKRACNVERPHLRNPRWSKVWNVHAGWIALGALPALRLPIAEHSLTSRRNAE